MNLPFLEDASRGVISLPPAKGAKPECEHEWASKCTKCGVFEP